jgi:hypothetical protein
MRKLMMTVALGASIGVFGGLTLLLGARFVVPGVARADGPAPGMIEVPAENYQNLRGDTQTYQIVARRIVLVDDKGDPRIVMESGGVLGPRIQFTSGEDPNSPDYLTSMVIMQSPCIGTGFKIGDSNTGQFIELRNLRGKQVFDFKAGDNKLYHYGLEPHKVIDQKWDDPK